MRTQVQTHVKRIAMLRWQAAAAAGRRARDDASREADWIQVAPIPLSSKAVHSKIVACSTYLPACKCCACLHACTCNARTHACSRTCIHTGGAAIHARGSAAGMRAWALPAAVGRLGEVGAGSPGGGAEGGAAGVEGPCDACAGGVEGVGGETLGGRVSSQAIAAVQVRVGGCGGGLSRRG